MDISSLAARTAALAAAVVVTLAHVWLIASYAYPQAGAAVVATAHAR